MFDQSTTPNPYAPPAAELVSVESFLEGRVWRDGNLLYIGNGAALPNRCFRSGELTDLAFPMKQFWQPSWVYWLVFLGVIPYLVASPMVGRYVELHVPLANRFYARHRQLKLFGFSCIVAGLVLLVLSFYTTTPSMALTLAAAALALGFGLTSRRPLHLNIVDFSGDVLVLQDVHPRFLDAVESQRPKNKSI
jgi:MFS family permease